MRKHKNKITVIDSIMGSGKTSWAFHYMNESPWEKRFIYITPYLDEILRIKSTIKNRKFYEPDNKNSEGRKLRSLKELIVSGYDICATHSLFQTADDELIELLTDSGYTLILDEVMNVIETANITRQDVKTLLDVGHIEIEGNRVNWINDDYTEGRFNDIKLLAKAGNLFIHRDTFLLWAFPSKVFEAFNDVIILTYLFDAQIQRYYYDLHGIKYQYKAVKYNGECYELTDYDKRKENRSEVVELIELYEGSFNDVGERHNALSATWLRNAGKDKRTRIKKDLTNYLRNQCKANSNEILWTTIKDMQQVLQGKGYTKAFAPVNLRATNVYRDRWALAYIFNRYMSPLERAFFEDNGVKINQDLLAVSDLLQWVWRTRIRDGKPIKLYLPSNRMRSLLKAWSKYEI